MASSNNAAVENITKELPVVNAIGAGWRHEAQIRDFRNLGPETVGWALIDEAGQAVLQAAAGLLWHTQRAIVVGDPLQLEPICRVPGEVQDRLRTHFDVGRYWLPSSTSAQGIADQHNRFGTFVRYEDRDGNAATASQRTITQRAAGST